MPNSLQQMIQPSLNQRLSSAKKALSALQKRTSHFEGLVYRPVNSKVLLTKTARSLEIVLPPAAATATGNKGIFAIVWNTLIFFFTGGLLIAPVPANLVFILFLLPFWAAGFSMAGGVLFGVWGRVRLTLDAQQIRQDYEIFGFKRSIPPPSLRQDISKLEITQPYFKKDSDGDLTEVKPQLVIWAGTRKYGYFGSEMLTQPELDWLAQELSLWLNLPIMKG
jgi:hypothetical protein